MPDLYPVDDPDDADPRLAPLLAWRQQLVDSGAVAARSFKEAHLRLVLRSGRTEVEQIREMLPGSVAEHAEEMARLLAELESRPPESSAQQGPSPAGGVHPIAFRHGESRPGVVELSWPDYQANGEWCCTGWSAPRTGRPGPRRTPTSSPRPRCRRPVTTVR
ncbi:hypothetical protein LT337_15790 [Mycolicibacterium fortuitum]|nr:hypothetical protein LT337_15790 [Mycolicibacterium fortuitum]